MIQPTSCIMALALPVIMKVAHASSRSAPRRLLSLFWQLARLLVLPGCEYQSNWIQGIGPCSLCKTSSSAQPLLRRRLGWFCLIARRNRKTGLAILERRSYWPLSCLGSVCFASTWSNRTMQSRELAAHVRKPLLIIMFIVLTSTITILIMSIMAYYCC